MPPLFQAPGYTVLTSAMKRRILAIISLAALQACSSGTSDNNDQLSETDKKLAHIIANSANSNDPNQKPINEQIDNELPSINTPLAQLGKVLFFTKGLGGEKDSACVTCHHPNLGGADNLALSVGVGATNPDLLGPGRVHKDGLPLVPRNAPTVFNIGLWDRSIFHDGRIESLSAMPKTKNGSHGEIRTPDSPLNQADPALNTGENLAAAQARFPVTSVEEMRGTFANSQSNEQLRTQLAERIGDYGTGAGNLANNQWVAKFKEVFNQDGSAEEVVTYTNIAKALGEYERSMVFVDHPWRKYMNGDTKAISEQTKQGALLFFTPADQGGAACSACHTGQLFSDEKFHIVAFPQIGHGKGNGANSDDDFGRERETGQQTDRYKFRTASLLNLKVTAPYGHSGSYETLEQVVRHHTGQRQAVTDYFDNGELCKMQQFRDIPNCGQLYPNARQNSLNAVTLLEQQQANDPKLQTISLTEQQIQQLVSFLEALTDPCVESKACMQPWIPKVSEAADELQLNAIDAQNNPL